MKRFEWSRRHPNLAAVVDWSGVFSATTAFIYVALWAASPDSARLTLEEAVWRSLSYSVPITLGAWGVSRATRPGSAVPKRMSNALPYARLGTDGKPEAVTWDDQTPRPMEGGLNADSRPGDNVANGTGD